MGVGEAACVLGLSERHAWRMLAAYRRLGAAALSHGNRGRRPTNATSPMVQAKIIALARERYQGVNHTHLTELLAEREGVELSRSTGVGFHWHYTATVIQCSVNRVPRVISSNRLLPTTEIQPSSAAPCGSLV